MFLRFYKITLALFVCSSSFSFCIDLPPSSPVAAPPPLFHSPFFKITCSLLFLAHNSLPHLWSIYTFLVSGIYCSHTQLSLHPPGCVVACSTSSSEHWHLITWFLLPSSGANISFLNNAPIPWLTPPQEGAK